MELPNGTDTPSNKTLVVFEVDGIPSGVGSAVYNGVSNPTSSTTTNVTGLNMASGIDVSPFSTTPGDTDLGTVILPVGHEVSGTISGGELGARNLQIRNGGTNATFQFVNARTKTDGTYSINLPDSTSFNARVCTPGVSCTGTWGRLT